MKIKDRIAKINYKIIIAFAIVLIFAGGFYFGKINNENHSPLAYSQQAHKLILSKNKKDSFDFNLYWEVWNIIKQNHFKKKLLSNKDLFYGSLRGLAESTNDPYTLFLDPKETKEFYDDLSGTFEGIGAEVGMKNDVVTIIAPLDGTPAQKAGLRSGDKIYAIDGESSLGLTLYQAVKKIRGEKGTKVTLTVIRGDEKPQDINIIRELIFVKSVKTKMRKDGVYVIKISSFNDDTQKLFDQAVKYALLHQPKGIVLDLRDDPGGYLNMAVSVASEWISAGPIVAEQFGENKRDEYPSNGRANLEGFKTVVLINQGSASASEIVAGALRDYKKAILIGEKSFGKGSVQTLKSLSDGSTIKVTIAKWLTPNGELIDKKGLKPDIEVDLTKEDVDNNRDPQMDRAVKEILKK